MVHSISMNMAHKSATKYMLHRKMTLLQHKVSNCRLGFYVSLTTNLDSMYYKCIKASTLIAMTIKMNFLKFDLKEFMSEPIICSKDNKGIIHKLGSSFSVLL